MIMTFGFTPLWKSISLLFRVSIIERVERKGKTEPALLSDFTLCPVVPDSTLMG